MSMEKTSARYFILQSHGVGWEGSCCYTGSIVPLKCVFYQHPQRIFEGGNIRLNAAHFKQLIISSLRELYGEIGAALPFDVLKFEENTLSAVLRVYSSALVRLWSALTLLGGYQGQPCGVRVVQVTPFLLALSGNSRELKLD
ncbi:ribonuclease P protein subunit p14-like isoform X3 [Acipenser ruthenus]|uniref:ribonuclease P protein subunit p14-like isoform X3 n=1 Tax=Acipenser ruthenus TaxID=7906 RepID=UPI0027411F8F|nr:ribonuclease P protein subunit p14-like isoform X3 [Acipenser ruthenus]